MCGQRRRRPVDGGGRRRPPAAVMVGTIHARHAVLSAPVCCPNCPSARAIRGGHLRGKRRHCDPRPRPPREGAYRAGAFQTGRGVCKCPPAQARVFARLDGSARPRAGACREGHLRSCGWSCVRRRRPRGHWRAVIMVSCRNGVCPRAFVARLDMARFTRVRVLRWVQHSRPVQLVLLPCGVHRTATCEWRASGRGTWKMAWGVREAISSKQPQVGWPWRGGELGLTTGVATGGRCERHVRRCV